ELRIVDVDLVRAGQPPVRLDQRAVRVLLLRGHLIVGDLGITSEGRRVGHGAVSCAEALLTVAMVAAASSVGAHSSAKAASRSMTRAAAARRPAVDLPARPNSTAKGSPVNKSNVTALGTCMDSTPGAPSLGPAPDPCNRHALTGM